MEHDGRNELNGVSRRDFLKTSSMAAVSMAALAGSMSSRGAKVSADEGVLMARPPMGSWV